MRTPVSTYRIQITEDFDLHEAARVLPYLHDLGVDWVYLSPLLAAEAHSNHGYDVSDHGRIDAARGGVSGLSAVSAEAHRLGMGVLVDIVPNHVGVASASDNAWWWSVLTHGQASDYADAFDIDWAAGGGRLRIPVVGDDDLADDPSTGSGQAGIDHLVVEAGQLRYHDHAFPLAPGTADDMDELGLTAQDVHARQHYELVSWRTADAGSTTAASSRSPAWPESGSNCPTIFAQSHDEIGLWFTDGLVDGLRIDHPDGLADPEDYLDDLAALTEDAYVLSEKIIEGDERAAPVVEAGRHDRLRLARRRGPGSGRSVGRAVLDELAPNLRGGPRVDWHAMIHDTKRAVADGHPALGGAARLDRETRWRVELARLPDA